MKTKHFIIQILTAMLLLLYVSGSAYSQNVISSVNVRKSAKAVSKHLHTNSGNTDIKLKDAENWMQNKSYLDSYNSLEDYKIKMMMYETVIENERALEDWMLDEKYWEISNSKEEIIEDKIRALESWMLDKSFWKIKDQPDRNELEQWMLDDKFWVMVK